MRSEIKTRQIEFWLDLEASAKMSSYKKGNLYEKEVRGILEAEGWKVEGQHRKASYIPDKLKGNGLRMIMQGRDIFGTDLIAKKIGEKPLWIQVSTRTNKVTKIKQVMEHPWNFEHETLQLWLRSDGKREFEIFQAPEFGSVGVKKAI